MSRSSLSLVTAQYAAAAATAVLLLVYNVTSLHHTNIFTFLAALFVSFTRICVAMNELVDLPPLYNDNGKQDATLSQGEPRDAAVHFDTYQIFYNGIVRSLSADIKFDFFVKSRRTAGVSATGYFLRQPQATPRVAVCI